MNTTISSELGHLYVNIDSTSVFFRSSVPIEIRDSNMRLLWNEDRKRKFKLQPGLYQVSAVLEDGREHKQLVEVHAGKQSKVEISALKEQTSASKHLSELRTVKSYRSINFTQKIETINDEMVPSVAPELDLQLLAAEGASLIRKVRGLWVFKSNTDIGAVPTAKLKIGNKTTVISLPTDPHYRPEGNACVVRIDNTPAGPRATAWISPERTVANAAQNMLASNQLQYAARLADEATELLRGKYSDPTGAALGALILHKVGRLTALKSWVRNLARDFAWMPDGKILLAALMVKKSTDRDKALQHAIEASKQRILYTESYSILLDLLRRWPGKTDYKVCNKAIADLARHSPFIDWDSICLSHTAEG